MLSNYNFTIPQHNLPLYVVLLDGDGWLADSAVHKACDISRPMRDEHVSTCDAIHCLIGMLFFIIDLHWSCFGAFESVNSIT